MTHRAESILVAVTAAVTGLATTGANVVRDQVWPSSAGASLSVDMGEEDPAAEPSVAFQDELLTVLITARAKAPHDGTTTKLNQIAAEVYAALMGSPLGLPYVQRVRWAGRSRPQGDAVEQAAALQELRFIIHYRHSYASAES